MELLLQALDEIDDLFVGARLAAMPWVAWLNYGGRLGRAALRPAAHAIGDAVERIDAQVGLLNASADAIQSSVLDFPLSSGRARSVRNVTE
ncbi:MAG TPA: hypothetical protein VFV10_17165 [Gammaproteobacteria bacterium]|nr:hypothetical protein [Gammaproteobacteria bacterium]